MKRVVAHFQTIKDDPPKFVLWFITAVILSLSSFWIPALLGFIIGKNFYIKLMENNPFIIFSIVFLSNAILTSINYVGGGSNRYAVAIRGITLVVTVMYLVLLSTIIPLKLVSGITLSQLVQFALLAVTIFLGIYVYGFREATWEKSVDDFRQKQDEDVEEITSKAISITTAGEDIKL